MSRRRLVWAVLAVFSFAFAALKGAYAEEGNDSQATEQKIDALAQEVEKLKAGEEVFVPAREGKYGMGPAASKVYGTKKGVSLGGYGEFTYHSQEDAPDEIDALRAILYVGYKFNDMIVFNSETEFEHATTEGAGSVSVEFAYLDFLLHEMANVRAGLILSPMGWINEMHEPPVFLGVNRPEVEQKIIPTTWRELGGGLFGDYRDFFYKAYIVSGLRAVGDPSGEPGGFTSEGLRDGRQNGSEALAEDFAFVGRVDYEGFSKMLLGVSGYVGNSGQGAQTSGGTEIAALTSIFEAHAQVRHEGAEFRGLFAVSSIDEADFVNSAQGFSGNESVGERLLGYYLQLGYDVLHLVETEQEVTPFFRYEWLNSQSQVPSGFLSDPANEKSIYTFGLSYKPIGQVAVKADYQINRNKADTGKDQFNLSLGYLF